MITSVRNPRIAAVNRLKRSRERRATGRTAIDGPFLLQEAVRNSVAVREVFALPDDAVTAEVARSEGLELVEVSPEVLERLASSVNPRGPVAVIDIPPPAELSTGDTIVLWEISDPGNAGTIIRTAAAFGFQVVASSGTVDLWSPKVLRAGVGGHFRTAIVTGIDHIEDLDRVGLVPLAMATGGIAIDKVDMSDPSPVAFIVGNEAHGLPRGLRDGATVLSLPMPGGTESLNAGVAASIAMFLRMTRRPGAGQKPATED